MKKRRDSVFSNKPPKIALLLVGRCAKFSLRVRLQSDYFRRPVGLPNNYEFKRLSCLGPGKTYYSGPFITPKTI